MNKELELLIENTVIELSLELRALQSHLQCKSASDTILTYVVQEQNNILQQSLKLTLLLLPSAHLAP